MSFYSEMLLEIRKRRILGNTDQGRIARARHDVRTRPPMMTQIDEDENLWMMEFNFKAFPSTEEKRHWGYIIYDEDDNDIKEMFCDCKDYFFRLRAPYARNSLAPKRDHDLPSKYGNRQPARFNGRWTVQTNPSGRLFACKHLTAALKGYMN